MQRRFGLFVGVLVWTGCGPSVVVNAMDSEGGMSGTGDSGMVDSGTSTPADEDATTAAVDESGDPLVCQSFADEATGAGPVTIELRNVGPEAILLDAPCFDYGFIQLSVDEIGREVEAAVQAIRESDCVDAELNPDEACRCEANAQGWCETVGSASIDTTLLFTAMHVAGSGEPIVIII